MPCTRQPPQRYFLAAHVIVSAGELKTLCTARARGRETPRKHTQLAISPPLERESEAALYDPRLSPCLSSLQKPLEPCSVLSSLQRAQVLNPPSVRANIYIWESDFSVRPYGCNKSNNTFSIMKRAECTGDIV